MNIEFSVLRKNGGVPAFGSTLGKRQGFPRNIAFAKGYRSVRLLVVEDDKDLNRQIGAALTRAGFAFDGEEGWFLGDTEPYDAVVLDLGLPKKDGASVLREWRRGGFPSRASPLLPRPPPGKPGKQNWIMER